MMQSFVRGKLVTFIAATLTASTAHAEPSGEQCRFTTRYDRPSFLINAELPKSYLAVFQDDCGGRFITRCYDDSGRCVDLTNRPAGQVCRIVEGVYSCISTSGHTVADDALSECLRKIDLSGDSPSVDAAAAACVAETS